MLRILVANIESARTRPELAILIDQHRPDVVIVLQAYRARVWLNGIPGYQNWQYRGVEASGIAVLVGSTIKLKRRRALRMTRPWIGPKAGHKHRPRTYPRLRLQKAGHWVRLLPVHLPTHNNPAAQAESLAAVRRWVVAVPNVFSVAAGDWNRMVEELVTLQLPVLTVGKVDHAVTSERPGTVAVCRRLPTPDDCHGWGLYAFDLETVAR